MKMTRLTSCDLNKEKAECLVPLMEDNEPAV